MTREERIEKVKEMHEEVMNFNDEELIMTWLTVGVPDCPTEEDFEWFADDLEEYKELVELFENLKGEDC